MDRHDDEQTRIDVEQKGGKHKSNETKKVKGSRDWTKRQRERERKREKLSYWFYIRLSVVQSRKASFSFNSAEHSFLQASRRVCALNRTRTQVTGQRGKLFTYFTPPITYVFVRGERKHGLRLLWESLTHFSITRGHSICVFSHNLA